MPPQADDKTALDYVTEAVKALNNASDNDFKLDYSAHIGDGYSNFIYKRRHASDKELWMSILDTGKRQKNAKWPFLVVDDAGRPQLDEVPFKLLATIKQVTKWVLPDQSETRTQATAGRKSRAKYPLLTAAAGGISQPLTAFLGSMVKVTPPLPSQEAIPNDDVSPPIQTHKLPAVTTMEGAEEVATSQPQRVAPSVSPICPADNKASDIAATSGLPSFMEIKLSTFKSTAVTSPPPKLRGIAIEPPSPAVPSVGRYCTQSVKVADFSSAHIISPEGPCETINDVRRRCEERLPELVDGSEYEDVLCYDCSWADCTETSHTASVYLKCLIFLHRYAKALIAHGHKGGNSTISQRDAPCECLMGGWASRCDVEDDCHYLGLMAAMVFRQVFLLSGDDRDELHQDLYICLCRLYDDVDEESDEESDFRADEGYDEEGNHESGTTSHQLLAHDRIVAGFPPPLTPIVIPLYQDTWIPSRGAAHRTLTKLPSGPCASLADVKRRCEQLLPGIEKMAPIAPCYSCCMARCRIHSIDDFDKSVAVMWWYSYLMLLHGQDSAKGIYENAIEPCECLGWGPLMRCIGPEEKHDLGLVKALVGWQIGDLSPDSAKLLQADVNVCMRE